MTERATIEEVVAGQYAGLSEGLRRAADIVVAHKIDIATRSLRAVSQTHGLTPATLSRLARALGFESYEAMRDLLRATVERRAGRFSDKAARLRAPGGEQSILDRMAAACAANIASLSEPNPRSRIEQAVDILLSSRKVILFGALGSAGIIEYFAHLGGYVAGNWQLAGRRGVSLAAALADLGPEDAAFIITTTPHAKRAVVAAETAAEQGARVIVVTDSHASPAAAHATVALFVPTETPQFFASYAATIVLIESLVAMLVARAPQDLASRIGGIEDMSRRLGEFWEES